MIVDKLPCCIMLNASSSKSLNQSCLVGLDGVLLLFDVTNKESFEKVRSRFRGIRQYSGVPVLLVGSKTDKESERVIDAATATRLAEELGIVYEECSSKTGENVKQVFDSLIVMILKAETNENQGGKRCCIN